MSRAGAAHGAASRAAAAPAAEIAVEGVTRVFGRREALHDVSFEVERGGFMAVFGPNGAGKTTLLRILATLLSPSAGRVTVAGHDPADDPTPVRRAIGFISHSPLLYRDLTAAENLRFYADMYGVADRERRIDTLLERVELTHRRHDVVRDFSRGMVQRLAVARALLHGPRVLLLDEPHSGLDARAVEILDGLLAEIRAEHTFVLVTHHIEKGLELAGRVLVVDGGRVVFRQEGAVDAAAFAGVYREHVREGVV